jgi:hypothetical protein
MFLHRLYRDLAHIATAVLAIIGFETALNISLQVYSFGEFRALWRTAVAARKAAGAPMIGMRRMTYWSGA